MSGDPSGEGKEVSAEGDGSSIAPQTDLTRPDHAYFFGFAQTNGNHYSGTRRRGRLTIGVSQRDESVLHSSTTLFDAYSRVSYRERTTNSGRHRSATWTVCDLGFREELVQLGLPSGRRSSTVAPPSAPFSVADYMRGLVDGDGSVGFTRAGRHFVGFVTAGQPLAEFFCGQALRVAGAYRTTNRNTRDDVYNLRVAGAPAAALAAWLYPDGCLALDRTRAAAAAVAGWTRPAEMRARPTCGARRWTESEDADVWTGTIRDAAGRLGRTEKA
ncbi:hypothetical protein [Blastococcus saxobsidens]|uniref:hypothetical protein n=1 Tax=Blastococcus saxobsidens TaxID=138336 RepID=UPI000CEC0EB2|nr:hypothetical protein [Blastococcus saxobsidens]